MKFADLRLAKPILETIASKGYHTATPIQAQTIPHTLTGRDVLGCAQTGTGKTAAFALPMLHRLNKRLSGKRRPLPSALVLAPTRELAQQIADSFRTYGQNLSIYGTTIFGGVGQGNQVNALRRGVDIVVATPGRLLDLINQGHCDLSRVNTFVLDEADRMLDMGFLPDIKKIIAHLPHEKQTLFFSATMPREIRKLADALLKDPAEVSVAPEKPAVERIEQYVHHVEKPKKTALLIELMQTLPIGRAIVFTRTKHGADRVAKQLNRADVPADSIHGDKSQGARTRALDRFRDNRTQVLVATDIAARGIDVDGISHVFNYDLSVEPENHIHRIGRTARAGADGTAISFCGHEEIGLLRAIERLMRKQMEVVGEEPEHAVPHKSPRSGHPLNKHRTRSRGQGQRGQGRGGQRGGQPGQNGANRGKKSKNRRTGKSKGHAAGLKGFQKSQAKRSRKQAKTGSGCTKAS